MIETTASLRLLNLLDKVFKNIILTILVYTSGNIQKRLGTRKVLSQISSSEVIEHVKYPFCSKQLGI